MFKGILVGLGIMVVSWLIPIAHFVLVPASPFLAGYFGINFAKPTEGSYAAKGLTFGAILGCLVLAISLAVVLGISFFVLEVVSPKVRTLMWIAVVVFTLYTGSMATLGAMYSALKARNNPNQPDEEDSGPAESSE